jgi:hypothetical protein
MRKVATLNRFSPVQEDGVRSRFLLHEQESQTPGQLAVSGADMRNGHVCEGLFLMGLCLKRSESKLHPVIDA